MKIDWNAFVAGIFGFIAMGLFYFAIIQFISAANAYGYKTAVEDCIKIAMKNNEPVAICLIMKQNL